MVFLSQYQVPQAAAVATTVRAIKICQFEILGEHWYKHGGDLTVISPYLSLSPCENRHLLLEFFSLNVA